MAGIKYSVPNNYNITEFNGLKGIVRHDKNGDKWTWQPFYRALLVSKTYGKILVAYAEAASQESYMKISSYNRQEHMQFVAYDIMFGENFLYVKTIRPSTKELEWCLVKEDFSGGTFLGDFEFMNRSKQMPFHIPIGTTDTQIKLEGDVVKKLKLTTGEIVEDDSMMARRVEKKTEEPPVTHYNVVVNKEEKKIQLLNTVNGKMLVESTCVGELETYSDIIKAILGRLDNIEKETAEKLIEFFKLFEHFVHGMVLPIVFTYVKHRNPKATANEMLTAMIKEVSDGWFTEGDKQFKVYIQGSIFLAMSRLKNGKITVAPYLMTSGDDDLLSGEEHEALRQCFKANGFNTVKLDIREASLDEVIKDAEELKEWPSPYSVRQRISFASDISAFTYKQIEMYVLSGSINAMTGESLGELTITVALSEDFTYKPKKRISGKASDWVKTNTSAAQIV